MPVDEQDPVLEEQIAQCQLAGPLVVSPRSCGQLGVEVAIEVHEVHGSRKVARANLREENAGVRPSEDQPDEADSGLFAIRPDGQPRTKSMVVKGGSGEWAVGRGSPRVDRFRTEHDRSAMCDWTPTLWGVLHRPASCDGQHDQQRLILQQVVEEETQSSQVVGQESGTPTNCSPADPEDRPNQKHVGEQTGNPVFDPSGQIHIVSPVLSTVAETVPQPRNGRSIAISKCFHCQLKLANLRGYPWRPSDRKTVWLGFRWPPEAAEPAGKLAGHDSP